MLKTLIVSMRSPVKILVTILLRARKKTIIPTYPPISAFSSNPTFTKSLPKEEMKEDLLVNSAAPFFQLLMFPSHKSNTYKQINVD